MTYTPVLTLGMLESQLFALQLDPFKGKYTDTHSHTMQGGGDPKITNWWISSAVAGYYHWLSSKRGVNRLIIKHCATPTTLLPTLTSQNCCVTIPVSVGENKDIQILQFAFSHEIACLYVSFLLQCLSEIQKQHFMTYFFDGNITVNSTASILLRGKWVHKIHE